MAPGIF